MSNYLKFASPSSDNPNWLDLLDARRAREYIDLLDESGACGASGHSIKAQKRLANHFDYAHAALTHKERLYYLPIAQKAPQRGARVQPQREQGSPRLTG